MTKDADYKSLVRARMRKTGERYAAARAALDRHKAAPPDLDTPALVRDLVSELLRRLEDGAPGVVVGFYLVGSIAYRDFRESRSDVDFVALVSAPLGSSDVAAVREAHGAVRARPPLDGIYVTADQLREGAVPEARFHDGVLFHADGLQGDLAASQLHYGSTPVTRRELATIGIEVLGPAVSALTIKDEQADLQRWVRDNLESYWGDWLVKASGLTPLAVYALMPRGIEWAVLGTARMLYTLTTGNVISKSDVGRWARDHVDARHHAILDAATNIRRGGFVSPLSFDRKAHALAFMSEVLRSAPEPAKGVDPDYLHRDLG